MTLVNTGNVDIDQFGFVFSDGPAYVGGLGLRMPLRVQKRTEIMVMLAQKDLPKLVSKVSGKNNLAILPVNAFNQGQVIYLLPGERIRQSIGQTVFTSPQPCSSKQESTALEQAGLPNVNCEIVVTASKGANALLKDQRMFQEPESCPAIYQQATELRDFLQAKTGLRCTLYPYFHEENGVLVYCYEIQGCACEKDTVFS